MIKHPAHIIFSTSLKLKRFSYPLPFSYKMYTNPKFMSENINNSLAYIAIAVEGIGLFDI